MKTQISIYDTNESYVREMQAFGNYLCANQEVDLAKLKEL